LPQEVTEGLVKLWRPKVNAKKLILFVEDLKLNPAKYFELKNEVVSPIECQYQTVNKTKLENTSINVEELLKKLVPAKSFLYRNQSKQVDKNPSYVPMEGGTKKSKKFFRLSSYEYPYFDFLSRFSRNENPVDRGYYAIKVNSKYAANTYKRQDSRTKYKSLPVEAEEKVIDDHFYEDLCYNDVPNKENTSSGLHVANVKPCKMKIQELFQSFKLTFFKKSAAAEDVDSTSKNDQRDAPRDNETNFYENSDFAGNMYDSVRVTTRADAEIKNTKDVSIYIYKDE
jgi:hypothetical protein